MTKKTASPSKKPVVDASARDRILRISAKLFATKGYDRVSVREIAKACKCNLSMISYYFGGKEKLYLAVFDGFFGRIDGHISRMKTQNDSGKGMSKAEFIEDIRCNIRFFIEEFKFDPYAKIVIHREAMDGFPRARSAFDKHFFSVKEHLFKSYERAQKSGCIKKSINIPTFLIMLNRCVESYLVAHMFATPISSMSLDPLKNTDEFVDQVEEIFLKGVLS